MTISFSIIIPAYKSRFLKACIDSVIVQTYSDWELIIVNDASPEDLDTIVNAYQDPRIRYYKNTSNYGAKHLVSQWNHCLSLASKKFVLCIGDDDMLDIHCLEIYSQLIERYPEIDILHGQTDIIDENDRLLCHTNPRPVWESAMSMLYHRTFSHRKQFIGDFCFRRDALLQNGGFYYLPYAWGSDDISALQVAETKGISNTQEVVFYYRDNDASITHHSHVIGKIHAIILEFFWKYRFLHKPFSNKQDNEYCSQLKRNLLIHTIKKCYYVIRNAY